MGIAGQLVRHFRLEAGVLIGSQVTVLGAGVAGLAVARALALRGAVVTVYEQSDAIREVGAGLQVSPNGACVLRALGLAGALNAASLRAVAVELRDGLDGGLVTRLEVGRLRPDQGYHFLHRADLIALLLEGAQEAGVELRLLSRVSAVDLAGDRPVLRFEDGTSHTAALLIGADGLHSPTRVALNGKVAPFFTGHVAWRAVIAGDGATLVAEVHMGPGRHLVSYPLRGGALRNIVAVEERRKWADESWSLRDDPMDLRLAFKGFGPRVQGWLTRWRMSICGACSAIRWPRSGRMGGRSRFWAMRRIRRCRFWRRVPAWGWRMPGCWRRHWRHMIAGRRGWRPIRWHGRGGSGGLSRRRHAMPGPIIWAGQRGRSPMLACGLAAGWHRSWRSGGLTGCMVMM